ncbi:MAG: ABC transporter permease [Methanobacteriota archaeon]|nr:MAG: ABC transporter permease [Euryarchaeota archaeon]
MGGSPPEADVMAAGEFFGEVGSIAGRWIKKTLRRPPFLFFSLVQPIVWFVLFTAAFAKIADIPGFASTTGTTSYLTFFSGAVIIQTVLASAMQSGVGFVTDMESGFLDKLKVAPIHRSSILLGKLLSDGARILLQTTVILILAFALGVGIATGLLGLVLLFGIALGFGIAWSGISTFIALTTRNSESTLMISLLTTFPLLFLSTAVMPKALLQDSVRSIAVYNPITYIADGLHGLIITPALDWSVVGFAFLIIAAVGFVTLSATTTMFRRTVSA